MTKENKYEALIKIIYIVKLIVVNLVLKITT